MPAIARQKPYIIFIASLYKNPYYIKKIISKIDIADCKFFPKVELL